MSIRVLPRVTCPFTGGLWSWARVPPVSQRHVPSRQRRPRAGADATGLESTSQPAVLARPRPPPGTPSTQVEKRGSWGGTGLQTTVPPPGPWPGPLPGPPRRAVRPAERGGRRLPGFPTWRSRGNRLPRPRPSARGEASDTPAGARLRSWPAQASGPPSAAPSGPGGSRPCGARWTMATTERRWNCSCAEGVCAHSGTALPLWVTSRGSASSRGLSGSFFFWSFLYSKWQRVGAGHPQCAIGKQETTVS